LLHILPHCLYCLAAYTANAAPVAIYTLFSSVGKSLSDAKNLIPFPFSFIPKVNTLIKTFLGGSDKLERL
jgi:hypothetical protein